jgi:hypothetical protein
MFASGCWREWRGSRQSTVGGGQAVRLNGKGSVIEAERPRPLEWVTVFPTNDNSCSLFPAAGRKKKLRKAFHNSGDRGRE